MPTGSERRRHNRSALQSQVAVTHVDIPHQLDVIDASLGGLFLEGDPRRLPEFAVGAEVTVRLFDESRDEKEDIVAVATVVRVVRGKGIVASGVALSFTEIDPGDEIRLAKLLARTTPVHGQA